MSGPRQVTSSRKVKSTFKMGLACLLFLILSGAGYMGWLELSGNFHEVISEELYRSNQPSPEEIDSYAKRYKIRTIVNLRGDNAGHAWYDEEVKKAKENNIVLVNFPMSSKRRLTEERAFALIDIMKNAQKPLLIHCQGGADRTSLATALYLAAVKKETETASREQLSAFYGHIPFVFRKTYAMDETFQSLKLALGYHRS